MEGKIVQAGITFDDVLLIPRFFNGCAVGGRCQHSTDTFYLAEPATFEFTNGHSD